MSSDASSTEASSPWNRLPAPGPASTELAIDRYPHRPLSERVWALRPSLSACDATYVALAEALDAVLVTTDRRLAGANGTSATVEVH